MSNFIELHLTHEIFRILPVFSQFLRNLTLIFSGNSRIWFANVAKNCVGLTHLTTLVKLRTYDWLSLNPLGDNGSRRRSKNIFRWITMGIGPIWGIRSLSFILSWNSWCVVTCRLRNFRLSWIPTILRANERRLNIQNHHLQWLPPNESNGKAEPAVKIV